MSFSYNREDEGTLLEAFRKATLQGFHSRGAYIVKLIKDDEERQKIIDPVEPNPIHVVYNTQDTLATMTVTEQPKGPTLEDILESLDKLPEIYDSLDSQQIDFLEAKLLARSKEVKDKSMYLRKKQIHDRIHGRDRDRPINNPNIRTNREH
jgi:hypothetical protein